MSRGDGKEKHKAGCGNFYKVFFYSAHYRALLGGLKRVEVLFSFSIRVFSCKLPILPFPDIQNIIDPAGESGKYKMMSGFKIKVFEAEYR
jgi:hypothetical protein